MQSAPRLGAEALSGFTSCSMQPSCGVDGGLVGLTLVLGQSRGCVPNKQCALSARASHAFVPAVPIPCAQYHQAWGRYHEISTPCRGARHLLLVWGGGAFGPYQ
jgi:hypothetical protein